MKALLIIKLACAYESGLHLFGKSAVDNGQVTIIYNGIDLAKFGFNKEKRTLLRKQLGIENKLIIGHIGRFNYQKNHDFLIDIAHELKKRKEKFVLCLVGIGELEREIKEKICRLDLEKEALFLGAADNVHEIVNAFDVFVFPSHFEGLPVTLIEAQANALAVVKSDTVSAAAEISNKVKSLSLKADVSIWADEILKAAKLPREVFQKKDNYYNYDIRNTVANLIKKYE